MNIYEKIQRVKLQLSQRELKKTGENTYSGFKFYQLSDILPSIIELCDAIGLFTQITFTNELGILNIIDTVPSIVDGKEEYRVVTNTTPMKELELKGANAVQALGGTETYLRRYLYMNTFDIVEGDAFDTAGFEKKQKQKKEKGALEDLIGDCKKEFLRLSKVKTDAKAKPEEKAVAEKTLEEVGSIMKKLGYGTFADFSKKQEKTDVIALAEALSIEVKPELMEEGK